MRSFLLTIFTIPFLFASSTLFSQEFTSSNLPIVMITTNNGVTIPDEPKIPAMMKVIWRPDGSRNYLTDQENPAYLNYNGPIGIEIRGSTSALLPKKPYGLETREADFITSKNVSILGLPKENDWVLNALAYDPSLMRDYLSYELAREMGQYSARSRYCEVFVNGVYQGLYLFMEKLKRDSERINIDELLPEDISGTELTGGYIIKADKANGDPVSWTMAGSTGTIDFIHDEPDPEEILPPQKSYIMDQFMKLRDMTDAGNENILTGYPSLIDVPSFIDFMLINELAANVDAYQFSTYFHKDKGGKLRAGPVWDFNLTYGNDLFFWGFNRSFTYNWQFDNGDNTGPFFWKKLYNLPTYKCYMSRRWKQLSVADAPWDLSKIYAKIDAVVLLTAEAAGREQIKWGTVANRTSNIASMKAWISDRFIWLNSQLSDFSACASPSIPSLVISKINYNPSGDSQGDLEFLEITNTGTGSVNTAGLYLREPGMTYNFPSTGSISAGQKIYLASNAAMFESFYGIKPFGEYERNLSNSTYNIVLSDAFGNVIDQVQYVDKGSWSDLADGKGAFLQLKDPGLDNSIPSSWIASNECFFTVGKPSFGVIGFCLNEASPKIPSGYFPGTTLKWFEDEAGTKPINMPPAPNTLIAGKRDYFIATRTASGCESERVKVTIAVSPKPELPRITQDLTDLSQPVLVAPEATTYQWFLYGKEIKGAISKTLQAPETGSYQLITSVDGCKSDLSLPVDLIVTAAVDYAASGAPVIYPNPASENIIIRFTDENESAFSLVIKDLFGKTLYSKISTGKQANVDLSTLPAGTYFLQIDRRGSLKTYRVVKTNN